MNRFVVAIGSALILIGCDKQVPQEITGPISLGSGPMVDAKLRLYASEKSCEGGYVEAATDANGAFRFESESTRGAVGVVTQSIAICAAQSGEWKPLWSTIIGGGAPRIALDGRLDSVEWEVDEAWAAFARQYRDAFHFN